MYSAKSAIQTVYGIGQLQYMNNYVSIFIYVDHVAVVSGFIAEASSQDNSSMLSENISVFWGCFCGCCSVALFCPLLLHTLPFGLVKAEKFNWALR